MSSLLREEITLISCYHSTDRAIALASMQEALPYMEDKAATELMAECVHKLKEMTDMEFTVAMHMGTRLVEDLFI